MKKAASDGQRQHVEKAWLVANQRLKADAWTKCLQHTDYSSSRVSYLEVAPRMASTSSSTTSPNISAMPIDASDQETFEQRAARAAASAELSASARPVIDAENMEAAGYQKKQPQRTGNTASDGFKVNKYDAEAANRAAGVLAPEVRQDIEELSLKDLRVSSTYSINVLLERRHRSRRSLPASVQQALPRMHLLDTRQPDMAWRCSQISEHSSSDRAVPTDACFPSELPGKLGYAEATPTYNSAVVTSQQPRSPEAGAAVPSGLSSGTHLNFNAQPEEKHGWIVSPLKGLDAKAPTNSGHRSTQRRQLRYRDQTAPGYRRWCGHGSANSLGNYMVYPDGDGWSFEKVVRVANQRDAKSALRRRKRLGASANQAVEHAEAEAADFKSAAPSEALALVEAATLARQLEASETTRLMKEHRDTE